MCPILTRNGVIALDEKTLIVRRAGRDIDGVYTRAQLTASTISRLNRVAAIGSPRLIRTLPAGIGIAIYLETNAPPF